MYTYTYNGFLSADPFAVFANRGGPGFTLLHATPNLPTKIIPAKIARLKSFGNCPLGLGIPPLQFKVLLESNPLREGKKERNKVEK